MIDRRALLALTLGLLPGAGLARLSPPALPSPPVQSRFRGISTRHLWLGLAGRAEEIRIAFRHRSGRPWEPGLTRLSWAFRDWKDGDLAIWMDIRLFDLLARLQTEATIRADAPVKLTLVSGFRTARRNRGLEGAVPNSHHCRGRAADILLAGHEPAETAALAEALGAPGLGRYPGFTHLDVGPRGRRW